ncbi:MAG: hypothetical protein MUF34_32405 [Polyangiaceae bacterium]|nr:hypothetical protein [Polyangiaceae bacterium]
MIERSVRPDVAIAVAVIAQQVGGKVARDAMFLARFPASALPSVTVASAVLSLAAVLLASRQMARHGPARLVPDLFALSGLAFLLEWALALRWPGASAVLVYLHTSAAGGLTVSGFWSIVNERFDPHVAKRNIIRVTTGATLGGLIGGLSAKHVAEIFEPRAILLALAAVVWLCAWGVKALGRTLPRHAESAAPPGHTPPRHAEGAAPPGHTPPRHAEGAATPKRTLPHPIEGAATPKRTLPRHAEGATTPLRAGLKPLGQHPYLRHVASMVVVVALVELFLDCALKTAADASLHDARALVSFFALFHAGVGAGTFLLQIALTRLSLEGLGLGGTLAVLPAAVAVAAALAAWHPALWAVAAAAGLETALASSLFRSAYEILFTPVPAHRKRALKVVIDVALPRVGAMLGSGAVALVVAAALPVDAVLLAGAAALGGLGVVYGVGLHRLYVAELATSLQLGLVTLAERDAVDATTRRTILSTMTLDRGRLLAQIEAARHPDARDSIGALALVLQRHLLANAGKPCVSARL